MSSFLADAADVLAGSTLHDAAVNALMTVPGLPPILQTLHILAIATLVASLMMVHLRVLGIAATGQQLDELIARSRPWTFAALAILFCSGLVFVLARPGRYLHNPVFGIKLALLIPALALGWIVQTRIRQQANGYSAAEPAVRGDVPGRLLSVLALVLWVGVILSGRWIAYVDYLFWEG